LKHRTKEEIAALILEAVVNTNRATQTIIMYKAYLTHAQLKQFLSSLLEKRLIQYQKEDRLYTITEKGMHFLQLYNQLNQFQTRNVLNATTEFQIVEPRQVADVHENGQSSSYLTIDDEQRARASNRRKCEKCLRLFTNQKELKLHKAENHSY
jgi:predicted transcriptional regulator